MGRYSRLAAFTARCNRSLGAGSATHRATSSGERFASWPLSVKDRSAKASAHFRRTTYGQLTSSTNASQSSKCLSTSSKARAFKPPRGSCSLCISSSGSWGPSFWRAFHFFQNLGNAVTRGLVRRPLPQAANLQELV